MSLFADLPPGIPPDVCLLFERLAFELRAAGWRRYSARAILHRIRWHHHVDRGNRTFKANDHWTPTLSRWLMDRHPVLEGFFETRASPYWALDYHDPVTLHRPWLPPGLRH